MKKLLFCFLLSLISLTVGAVQDSIPAQDSIKFAYGDLKDLYKYARDGYYLTKIDTLNNVYIISLEKEVKGLRISNEKLELIIDKDTELIESLFRVLKNREIENKRLEEQNKELKETVKRLRRDKLEAIITGGVTIAILTLVQLMQ